MSQYVQARKNMVDCQIHTSGVLNPGLLEAFRSIPREKFVPPALAGIAYLDEEITLGQGRFLLAPAVLARMIEAAQPTSTEHVLDIGGGTGYAAMILGSLAGQVTALEDNADFAAIIASHAKGLRLSNVTALEGPLPNGHAEGGPYDLIFMNGAVSHIPQALAAQLKPDGRLITIFKDPGAVMGRAMIMRHSVEGQLSGYPLFEAGCGYLPGFEPRPSFSFDL